MVNAWPDSVRLKLPYLVAHILFCIYDTFDISRVKPGQAKDRKKSRGFYILFNEGELRYYV